MPRAGRRGVRPSMPAKAKPPSASELKEALGSAAALWSGILRAVEAVAAPVETQWRPSKSGYGRICLLRRGERTLLYMTPDRGRVWIAIVLGERAFGLAMAGAIPDAIKGMLADARPYAEGRGIRYPVDSQGDIAAIAELVRIKTTPKQ